MHSRLISHRGNLVGPDKSVENRPTTVLNAIVAGFMCEVDLWEIAGQLYLGHDDPEYPIKPEFLQENNSYLIVHCKNPDALWYCKQNPEWIPDYFWHQTDQYTLTNLGMIWAYPNANLLPRMTLACPEMAYTKELVLDMMKASPTFAICTDYPLWYAEKLKA